MKITNSFLWITSCLLIVFSACQENETFPETYYDCSFSFNDTSAIHPSNAVYQDIIDRHQKDNIVACAMMVKDKNGTWLGASGQADIASDVDAQSLQ